MLQGLVERVDREGAQRNQNRFLWYCSVYLKKKIVARHTREPTTCPTSGTLPKHLREITYTTIKATIRECIRESSRHEEVRRDRPLVLHVNKTKAFAETEGTNR